MRKPRSLFLLTMGIVMYLANAGFAEELLSDLVTVPCGSQSRPAFVFKPKGEGPFPVVVWLHGHAKNLTDAGTASEYTQMASIFVNDGYAVFIPDRHMSTFADSEFSDKVRGKPDSDKDAAAAKDSERVEMNRQDVLAALAWIRSQSYVKTDRIVLMGWSSGAGQALLAAEKDRSVAACVPFSPAVTNWRGAMKGAVEHAVRNINCPVFLIQSKNDPTLEPSKVLLPVLEKRNPMNRLQLYSWSGKSESQATSLSIKGSGIWGYTVLKWLDSIWESQSSGKPASKS